MRTRESSPDLAALASLFADGTRAAFCLALLDGRAWTASELARHARVAPSTATEHLHLLVAGGILAEERQGRHRYLRLAGPDIAVLIETIAAAAPRAGTPVRTLAQDRRHHALARARTCYDHLAGELGVAVTDAMTLRGLLDWDRGLVLTEAGAGWFADLGLSVEQAGGGRRPLVRSCLDWTQRQPHLAGLVGGRLCQHAFEQSWITRIGTSRAVTVTAAGRDAFQTYLGLELGTDGAAPAL